MREQLLQFGEDRGAFPLELGRGDAGGLAEQLFAVGGVHHLRERRHDRRPGLGEQWEGQPDRQLRTWCTRHFLASGVRFTGGMAAHPSPGYVAPRTPQQEPQPASLAAATLADEALVLQLGPVSVSLTPQALALLAAAVAAQPEAVLPVLAGESPYLTVKEAAAYLRSSRQRVYDLLSARRIPKAKDGARVLVRRTDLDRYLHQEAG